MYCSLRCCEDENNHNNVDSVWIVSMIPYEFRCFTNNSTPHASIFLQHINAFAFSFTYCTLRQIRISPFGLRQQQWMPFSRDSTWYFNLINRARVTMNRTAPDETQQKAQLISNCRADTASTLAHAHHTVQCAKRNSLFLVRSFFSSCSQMTTVAVLLLLMLFERKTRFTSQMRLFVFHFFRRCILLMKW